MGCEIDEVSGYDGQYLGSSTLEIPRNLHFEDRIFRTTDWDKREGKTILPMGVGAEAKVVVEWGGSDGISVSGFASGNISDDIGNKAEIEVSIRDDGSGSASISVSHNEDSDS